MLTLWVKWAFGLCEEELSEQTSPKAVKRQFIRKIWGEDEYVNSATFE